MTASLAEAEAFIRAGRFGLAVGALRGLVAVHPSDAAAQELLATALERTGDNVSAEAALRAALAADPGQVSAASRLASRLTATRRAAEAIALLSPLVADTSDTALLTAYGAALKSEGRFDEAVPFYGRAQAASPASGAAWHNLAGALGDAQHYEASLEAIESAFAHGIDSAATWLVRGRSLRGLGRFEEAEEAFRAAIQRLPDYADPQFELAQLVWMKTGDFEAATEAIDRALKINPQAVVLSLAKAKLLEYAISESAAYASLGDRIVERPQDATLQTAASLLALKFDAQLALDHARRAVAAAPGDSGALAALCQALISSGEPAEAASIAEALHRQWPNDQYPITISATAWRMLGDPRYHARFDYDRLVRSYPIETPAGWPSLEAYLAELATSLRSLHNLRTHPIGQSLRQGTQTVQSLTRSQDPAIKALFDAIVTPLQTYIAALAGREDSFARRATSGWRLSGAWSVLLQPGGHHVNHIHQMGWISSAFHVELPSAVNHGQEGWLKFGEPGLPTHPQLEAEHLVRPQAGTLVLFPSYMWHGTVPFGGTEPRLTVAFDAVPA